MCNKLELIYSSFFSTIVSVLYLAWTKNPRLWQLGESARMVQSSPLAQIPFIPALLTHKPGGGYSIYRCVGRCGPAPHTLTLFKTNIADFPTLFKTELQFLIPCLRHLKLRLQDVVWLSCCVISGNLMCLVSLPKSTEVNIN